MSESAADAIAERYGVDHLPDDMPGFNCLSPLYRCAANRRAVCGRRGDRVNVVNEMNVVNVVNKVNVVK